MTNVKNWKTKQIKDLLDYERPDKYIVEKEQYIDAGIPVLTANKSFILGYTDEKVGIYENVPAIIFDDFTTDSKFVDFPFKVKSSAIKILKEKSKEVDLRFVFERMKSISFPTGNHKRYYISQYQNMKIAVPSLSVQQKISNILSTIDDAIEKTDQIIQKTEKIKRGLMNQLFYSKAIQVPLGKYVEIRSGDSPSNFSFIDGGAIPFYKVEDMNQSQKYLVNTRYHFMAYKKPLMPKGMVIFPKRGAAIYTNKVRILSTTSYFDTNVMGLVAKKGLSREYLYYLLIYIGLSQFADTTSVAQINNKHIEPLLIPLPNENEQQKISIILSSFDNKITIDQEIKNRLITFKKGLMSDIFSQKVEIN